MMNNGEDWSTEDESSMSERTRFQKENCMASESDQHGSTMARDLLRVFGMGDICILLSFSTDCCGVRYRLGNVKDEAIPRVAEIKPGLSSIDSTKGINQQTRSKMNF